MKIRTRFAPSPTGFLHIGGARTALFSYLVARQGKGDFILRIEDTDLERSTPESIKAILDGMVWLELDYDEGPYYQTQRFDRYREIIQTLLTEGKAYKCYCPKERLEALREEQMSSKQKPRYDGFCRLREPDDPNAPFVVRFKNPIEGEVIFEDLVRGQLSFANVELDDLIIARSDGTPTYNFTVVVDDMDMKITHVVRGDDHINNTPRQINILEALGYPRPIYAHVPMILGQDGKRLSKRHGAVSVLEYRDQGYLPEALLNYLVRLGWSHGDEEIFSREQMIEFFSLNKVQRAPAAFNVEKLNWLNQHYLKTLAPEVIAKKLAWYLNQRSINTDHGPELKAVVEAQRERCKTLVEMVEKSEFFFRAPAEFDEKAARQNLTAETLPALKMIINKLSAIEIWEAQAIHASVSAAAEELSLKMGKVAQPVRVALTGNTVSPPIDQTLALLGKQQTISRLERAVQFIEKM